MDKHRQWNQTPELWRAATRWTDSGHGVCIGGHHCQWGGPRHRGSHQVSAEQQGRKQDPRDLEVCGASAQRRQM